jgi:hypothetical protein
MKVVRLSALCISRLYPQETFLVLNAIRGWADLRPMKNPNDTIENRTRDLPACSSVPQPSAPLCIPFSDFSLLLISYARSSGDVKHSLQQTIPFSAQVLSKTCFTAQRIFYVLEAKFQASQNMLNGAV